MNTGTELPTASGQMIRKNPE